MLINIILYAVVIFMVFRVMNTSKRQKKNKVLIDCVNSIKQEDEFFPKVDEMIETIHDEEFETKAKVIKLWGIAYHNRYERFEDTLNTIDLTKLISMKKGVPNIDLNEDSFFYMYLGIPNMLYKDSQLTLSEKLLEKMQTVDSMLEGQLVREISLEINHFYKNEGDLGYAFYEKVMTGDYSEYTYSKTMIGLYKSIINSMEAKIYEQQGDTEKYETTVEMLEDFNMTGVGYRWIQSLGLTVKDRMLENEENADGEEKFQITEDSSKNVEEDTEEVQPHTEDDVIDAEVTNETEVKEEEK